MFDEFREEWLGGLLRFFVISFIIRLGLVGYALLYLAGVTFYLGGMVYFPRLAPSEYQLHALLLWMVSPVLLGLLSAWVEGGAGSNRIHEGAGSPSAGEF